MEDSLRHLRHWKARESVLNRLMGPWDFNGKEKWMFNSLKVLILMSDIGDAFFLAPLRCILLVSMKNCGLRGVFVCVEMPNDFPVISSSPRIHHSELNDIPRLSLSPFLRPLRGAFSAFFWNGSSKPSRKRVLSAMMEAERLWRRIKLFSCSFRVIVKSFCARRASPRSTEQKTIFLIGSEGETFAVMVPHPPIGVELKLKVPGT